MSTSEIAVEENFVSVFSSSNHDAKMEAMTIKGILETVGVPAMVIGPQVLPSLEFQVQVPGHLAAEASAAIDAARTAGPAAAEEGEAESER